eukprot:691458_1
MSVPQKSLSVESTDSERERERQWEFQLRFPANQLGVDTDGEDSQNEMDDNDKENIIDDITTTEEEDDDIIKDIVTTEEEDISTTEEEEKDVEAKEEAADEEEGAEHGKGDDEEAAEYSQYTAAESTDLILMQRLARFVFTIKGSSCPSEGMFRDYGNIVGAKTARLNEKKAEDTLFLHQLRKGLDD